MRTAVTARTRPRNRGQQIEDAAARLFADRGYAGTGMNEIAAAVDITAGAIYRHFASKEALLEAVMLDVVRQYNEAACVEAASADDRLHELVTRSVDVALTRAARVATYMQERPSVPSPLKVKLRRHERQLFDSWRAAIAAANPLPPGEIAVRQAAVNGILTALVQRRHTVRRPRLDRLAVAGVMAVLMAPASRPTRQRADRAVAWTPPRSRRVQIMSAAATMFRQSGYDRVSTDEIGEAAGIAGPTLYGTFASKAEILAEIYDDVLAHIEVESQRALESSTSAGTALRSIVRAYVDVAFSKPDSFVVASNEARALGDHDRSRMARRRADYRALWADILGQVRPRLTEAEARTFASAAFTIVQRLALTHRTNRPGADAAVELTIAFLLAPIPEP